MRILKHGDYGYWAEAKDMPCIVLQIDGKLRGFSLDDVGEYSYEKMDEQEIEFFKLKGNAFDVLFRRKKKERKEQ